MSKFSTTLSIAFSIIALGAFAGDASADGATGETSMRSPQLVAAASTAGVATYSGLRIDSKRTLSTSTQLPEAISATPIRFVSRSGELGPVGRRNLRRLVVPLMVNSGTSRIVIEGHSDLRGNAEVNDRIALERAEEVREYLTSIGIPAELLVVRSAGARRPLIARRSEAAGRVNRRVELRLTR